MSFHQSYQSEFIGRGPAAGSTAILGNAANYDVRLDQANAASGETAWRVLGVHHLTPSENGGKHVVFVDIVDEQGNPLRDPNLQVAWGWEGQRADEPARPKKFDKGMGEPASNVDVYSGQNVWVKVEGDGLPSDVVSNMHTKHADEPGPHGETWTSIGHHSFYVLFQRTTQSIGAATGTAPGTAPTPEPTSPQPNPAPPVQPPSGTSGLGHVGPFSHQDLINAFSWAAHALQFGDPWALLIKTGVDYLTIAREPHALYQGPLLHALPNLGALEQKTVVNELIRVLQLMPTPPAGPATPITGTPTAPAPANPTPANPAPAEPTPARPGPPPPVPAARGNKLGFYCHVSTNEDDLWGAIQRVQPPIILTHADTVNKMLLQEIRRFRSPDTFVVGRMYKDNHTQRMMLEENPEHHGRAMAEEILAYDFGLATQRGENGRLLIDAWMSLNETVPGPGSGQFREKPQETARMLANYDRFQVAFHQKLAEAGVGAIAFNFGAGNFGTAAHYMEHFPQTLQTYTYLGFHEYGWPTMYPDGGSATSAGTYRQCLEGIRAQFGDQHRVIMTEAGLTRMYQNPQWGDKGWLNDDAPLTEDQYWESLKWYNNYMLQDDYVIGACLYEVGHHGDWRTFRHLGKDHQGNDIRLIDRMVALKEGQARAPQPLAMAAAESVQPKPVSIKGRVTLHGFGMVNASVRLLGGDETLGATAGACLDAPSLVTWSRQLSGVEGRLWDLWLREVAQEVAGISWDEFKQQFALYNPTYDAKAKALSPKQRYWLPENRSVADEDRQIPITWDRTASDVDGSLWDGWIRYGQNKVVGLTYDQFKAEMVAHNPTLENDGKFVCGQHYSFPRNEGYKRYAMQAQSNTRGGFAFDNLLPGSYELIITANGTKPYRNAFSIEANAEFEIMLSPLSPPQMRSPLPVPQAMARSAQKHDFVQVAGQDFVEQGQTFPFIGVNIRGLVHYGDKRTLSHSSDGHRNEQLQAAYDMGARVVRVFLPTMHADAATTIERFHQTVKLVSDSFPGLYLLPCFANLYADVPFRIPGDEGFYGRIDDNWNGDLLSGDFFHGGFEKNYLPFVRQIVQTFAHDPVIFGWEIGNELKLNPAHGASMEDPNLNAFVTFMHRAASEIRQLDRNHLITTGMISTRHCHMEHLQPLKERLYSGGHFDFMTVHCYNHEYENDDGPLAQALNMPFIIEEAGFDMGFEGGDRVRLTREDMDRWFNGGAKGYMPWGFMATHNDIGDGDGKSGMDRTLSGHNDWDGLFNLYKERANQLAGQRRPVSVPPKRVKPNKPVTTPTTDQSGSTNGTSSPPSKSHPTQMFAMDLINVRKTPGHINPPGEIIGQLAAGTPLAIVGKSVTRDNLVWWPMAAQLENGQSMSGWVAQSTPGHLLVSTVRPVLPAAVARREAAVVLG